jgi:hypothetical protein
MLQVSVFGSYEGRLRAEKKLYFTMFGGSDLMRPSLARRIERARRLRGGSQDRPHRCVVVTLFGATEIKSPTLAEEYLDLKAMMDAGLISLGGWDRDVSDVQAFEETTISGITLFGGFDEDSLPEEDTEVDALATHRHLGNISEAAGKILELGIGQTGGQRYAVLREALGVGRG